MYCINCGVALADTEKKCPLCDTTVYHPNIKREEAIPLYPKNKMPKAKEKSRAVNGVILILFFIPVFVTLLSDLQGDGKLNWFGFSLGGIVLAYIVLALPIWFKKPNPVIFVPCSFAAATVYLLYICLATGGNWFLSFAFPLMGGLCLIVTTTVTLFYYLKKGTLFILGGCFMALGVFTVLIEILLNLTFKISFIGWSIYPLAVLLLFGGLFIFLAISTSAREIMERKLFI